MEPHLVGLVNLQVVMLDLVAMIVAPVGLESLVEVLVHLPGLANLQEDLADL